MKTQLIEGDIQEILDHLAGVLNKHTVLFQEVKRFQQLTIKNQKIINKNTETFNKRIEALEKTVSLLTLKQENPQ